MVINKNTFKNCRELDFNFLLQLFKQNPIIIASWGAHNFKKIKKEALKFTVQGYHHQGYIYISLNGLDLFDVHLTNYEEKIIEKIENLYFDQLIEILDKKIEYISLYKN